MRRLLLALPLLLLPIARPLSAQQLQLIPGVREIESDTILDLAEATVDQVPPIVFVNPRLSRRYGPELTRFFIAHEYGHLAQHHTRKGLLELPDATRDSLLRVQELEADCYAAALPGAEARTATEAAIRFFTRLGPFRFNSEHPTGAQRVSRILGCLSSPREPVRYGRGDTGVERGPVSGEPEFIRFELLGDTAARHGAAERAVIWMDGVRVGEVAGGVETEALPVDRFPAGLHSYRILLNTPPDRAIPWDSAPWLEGNGHLVVREGDRFAVEWVAGSRPRLVKLEQR